jgi:hypothetical protein
MAELTFDEARELAQLLRENQLQQRTATGEQLAQLKLTEKALKKMGAESDKFGSSMDKASYSAKGLTDQFIKGTATLGSVGKEFENLSKILGSNLAGSASKFSNALGTVVKILGTAGEMAFAQTQQALLAKDDLAKVGAAGNLTAKEVLTLAQNAGYSSNNIEKFNNGVKTAGTGLLNLGKNAAEGIKVFGQISAVGNDTIAGFASMGVSQDRLTELQGEYIKTLELSGKNIRSFGKDNAEAINNLKAASLEYTKNLVVLSGLSGKSVQQVEKEQKEIQINLEYQLRQRELGQAALALEKEAQELRKNSDAESIKRADELDKLAKQKTEERNKNDQILSEMQNKYGKEAMENMRALIASGGSLSEASAALASLGINTEKVMKDIKDPSVTASQAATNVVEEFGKKLNAALDNYSTAIRMGGGAELGKKFLVNLETVQGANKAAGMPKTYAEAKAEEQAGVDKKLKEAKGGIGGSSDPAENARRLVEETARNVSVKIDKTLAEINPMLTKLDELVDKEGKVIDKVKQLASTLIKDVAIVGGAIAAPAIAGQAGKKPGATAAKLGLGAVATDVVSDAIMDENPEAGNAGKVAAGALTGASIGSLLGILHKALGPLGVAIGALSGGISAYLSRNERPVESRGTGTFGMTGQLTEPRDTISTLERGEMVLTPDQQKDLFSRGGAITESSSMAARFGVDVEKMMRQIKESTVKNETEPMNNVASDRILKMLSGKFDEMISKLDTMVQNSTDANNVLKNSHYTLDDLLKYTRA